MNLRLLLGFPILLSTPAFAEGKHHAAVGSLELDPSLPAYLRDKAAGQLTASLAAAGDDVLPSSEGADIIVTARIVKPDDNSTITLRLTGAGGAVLAELSEVCELCGEAELLERFGIAVSTLRAKAAAAQKRAETPVVVIPPPEAPAAKKYERVRGSLIPGIAVGAVGLASIGVGVISLALDGRGTCSPGDGPVYPDPGAVIRFPDPDDPTRYVCREIYQTRTLGIVAAGVGVVAIAASVALVVRATRGSMLEVSPTTTGAQVKATFRW